MRLVLRLVDSEFRLMQVQVQMLKLKSVGSVVLGQGIFGSDRATPSAAYTTNQKTQKVIHKL